jgi:hypothetical protein
MMKRPWRLVSGGSFAIQPLGLPQLSVKGLLPIVLIQVIGIACLVCMYLYYRRFDVDEPDDGDDWGGDDGSRPGPDDGRSLSGPEPPLGEIRAYRPHARERRAKPTASLRS